MQHIYLQHYLSPKALETCLLSLIKGGEKIVSMNRVTGFTINEEASYIIITENTNDFSEAD